MPALRRPIVFLITGLLWWPIGISEVRGLRAQTVPTLAVATIDPDLAVSTFDSVWSRVAHTHYDPEMGGLDWDGIREELRPRVRSVTSTSELRSILTEMLARLGESHFTIIPGSSASAFDPSALSGPTGEGDPGIEVRWIDGSLLVTRVRPGSPAERAGIEVGWVVERIDEEPIEALVDRIREVAPPDRAERQVGLWLPGAARGLMLGPEGSSVELFVRDDLDRGRGLLVPRAVPTGQRVAFGNLPPLRIESDHQVLGLENGEQVGVLRWTAWFPIVVPSIARAMDQLRGADAIVIDLRGNPGGVGGLVMGVGGHFLAEPVSLGTMRMRDGELRFVVNPQRVSPDGERVDPYSGPLLILVDALTGSTSEIFAGGLQSLGRAIVVGETTAGQALPALVVPLPNGDRLLHAVADFTGPDGVRLEGRGVEPDRPVRLTRAQLLDSDDPAMAAALEWIRDH